jgi:5-methyltetrahydrofolate--homocysteine methyltransferase
MKTILQALLSSRTPIIADGGMGTMLFSLGLANGEAPELWNVEQPDKVRSVHRAYIEAGAQIVLTNTFGGNRLRLAFHGIGDRTAELNQAAARLLRQEADASPHPVLVAGSMGPTGGILMPYGELDPAEVADVFEEQARALIVGGVDVLWIETMSALEEVEAAVQGIRHADPDFPIVVTMTFDLNGHTMMGVSPERAVEAISGLGVVALGANCGNGPREIEGVIAKMRAVNSDIPLVAKSNAGMPHLHDDRVVYDATPEDMGEYAITVRNLGASIIGACCGSTPEHIRMIRERLQPQPV